MSEDKAVTLIAVGIILTVLTCAVVFYGSIAYVVVHFIHKFW